VNYWNEISYFNPSEFDSPDIEDGGQYMDEEFIRLLDKARKIAGVPFVIISGARTPEHNAEVGGVPDSAHIIRFKDGECIERPCAVDINTVGSRKRFKVQRAIFAVGFDRMGIGKNFLHVDLDRAKPPEVAWDYYD